MQQMRLVSSSQELAVRLLRQGSAMAASASATSTTAAAIEAAKPLETPKSLESASQVVPALKESPELDVDSAQQDTIPALRASPEEASSDGTTKANGRTLVFRPIKKAISNVMKNNKQPLVEVEGPVARLTIEDVADGPVANGTLVAM